MENATPDSRLTFHRPDLWRRAMLLATDLTHYDYRPKLPLPDGTIYACGGGGWYRPPPREPERREPTRDERERIKDIEKKIEDLEEKIDQAEKRIEEEEGRIREWRDEKDGYQDQLDKLQEGLILCGVAPAPIIVVPDGAMEWLLHEVGHWIAASRHERLLPDYGYGQGVLLNGTGADRELEAWAFEEVVLTPVGNPRELCPPQHRGGTAWERDIEPRHRLHISRRLGELGATVAVEQWRALYGEWAAWERESSI